MDDAMIDVTGVWAMRLQGGELPDRRPMTQSSEGREAWNNITFTMTLSWAGHLTVMDPFIISSSDRRNDPVRSMEMAGQAATMRIAVTPILSIPRDRLMRMNDYGDMKSYPGSSTATLGWTGMRRRSWASHGGAHLQA